MKVIKSILATLGLVVACNIAANAQTADNETIALVGEASTDESFTVEATAAPTINVWPQVTSIKIMVDVENAEDVKIYNAAGRLVKTQKVDKGQGINIETLIPGPYTVKVGEKVGTFIKK